MKEGRRLVRIMVEPEALLMMLRDLQAVPGSLPASAELIGCYLDAERATIHLIVGDPSFAPVTPGDIIPERVVTLRRPPPGS